MTRLWNWIRRFFFPPTGSPLWMRILPYGVLGALTLTLIVAGVQTWEYTNSPGFCGTTCHTMPPEYSAYLVSPHARVDCVDCHIGRDVVSVKVTRKAGDLRHVIAMTFRTYEYPIFTKELRPARESCERCHYPQKFSDDSLREIKHFANDVDNTPTSIFLIMKTGGGSKRQGLGRGIHWHVENKIQYYATDKLEQTIPYVRVTNEDGSMTEYTDVASSFDPAQVNEKDLKTMDCITCHNRITHNIPLPGQSVDSALARDLISPKIPGIKAKAVEVLSAHYASPAEASAAIEGLTAYYQQTQPGFYADNSALVDQAISALQGIYSGSVFLDQKVDWSTHPRNLGHKDWPGCFRCHDGKHLTPDSQAIRLECNLCHSIPDVAGSSQFLTDIEINRGPEPESHLNTNWIAIHRTQLNESCSMCHNTANAGGTDNTSFCSNSACHGTQWTYAGFDAPALAELLAAQMPTPEPTATPAPVVGNPTYELNILPIFKAKCGACHGDAKTAGLRLTVYADALAGSANGPVIVPSDSANSKIVEVQSNKHFANLTTEELELVKEWIDAGALEK